MEKGVVDINFCQASILPKAFVNKIEELHLNGVTLIPTLPEPIILVRLAL